MSKTKIDAQRFRKTYASYRVPPREIIYGGEVTQEDLYEIDWKQSVRVATTTSLGASLPNESSKSSGGPLIVDGYTMANGDRILIKDQVTSSQNGIYVYYFTGPSTYWFARSEDAKQGTLSSGAATYVEEGTTNSTTAWILTSFDPIAVDSDPQVWDKFGGGGIFTTPGPGDFRAKTEYSVSFDSNNRYPDNLGADVYFFVSGSISGSGVNDDRAVFGGDVVISGSLRQGDRANAKGKWSHSEGSRTTASGLYSHAEGEFSVASGQSSHAEGSSTTASGLYSHAEGDGPIAAGETSHAEGFYTIASGKYSHAAGQGSIAYSIGSFAHGYYTNASKDYSHAEGYFTTASGSYSHAEGLRTIASGSAQHVGGKYNVRGNDFSLFVIGDGSGDSNAQRHDVLRVNSGSVEVTGSLGVSGSLLIGTALISNDDGGLGLGTDVSFFVSGSIGGVGANDRKSVFGGDVRISGSLAVGTGSVYITSNEVQFGGSTVKITKDSLGNLKFYDTANSSGQGLTSLVSIFTSSPGDLRAKTNYSVSFDSGSRYPNELGTDTFFFVSGSISGSSSDDRRAVFGGDVVVSGSLRQGDSTNAKGKWSHAEGTNTNASGQYSHAEGYYTLASGIASHAGGYFVTSSGNYSNAVGYRAVASGHYSHAEGDQTLSSGDGSHAEGWLATASAAATHAEGWGSLASTLGSHAEGYYTVASSICSHAEGGFSTASGQNSHAEGLFTISSGPGSHAEGYYTVSQGDEAHAEGYYASAKGTTSHAEGYYSTASGSYSHAEGRQTIALGEASHAEGRDTIATGSYSHAEGIGTIASGSGQHVGGNYNVRGNDFSLFVIGDGTGDLDANRHDIFRVNIGSVEVSGSLSVSGTLYQGSTAFGRDEKLTATLQTTDAVAQLLYTQAIPTDSVVTVVATVSAIKSDGSEGASYQRRHAFRNDGGTSAELGSLLTLGTDASNFTDPSPPAVPPGRVIIERDVNTWRIKVIGIASTTIRWFASIQTTTVFV